MIGKHKIVGDYPIIVSVLNGTIETENILMGCQFIDRYLTKNELHKVYWIMDAATIDFSRSTAINIAEVTQDSVLGSGGDPRVVPLVIMPIETYAPIADELKNRLFRSDYPRFQNIYEALSFAIYLSNLDNYIN